MIPKSGKHSGKRIHRPRRQTPEQEAAEQAIRDRLQKEKPSLQSLIDSSDASEVLTMGQYWELRQAFAALKALREEKQLSISELAERTGMDRAMISRLENGQIDNPTISTLARYASAMGKRFVVTFMDV